MPWPQPARNPLPDDGTRADDSYLYERFELISKKYIGGLDSQETTRLAQIEESLDQQDSATADLIDTRSQKRMSRIDATLDRVENAIRELQASKLQ
jgi:chemotaxis protein histidine kinase CheA